MITHAPSLLLVWQLAEMESLHARRIEIEPAYFFLALLKAADLDWAALLAENPNFSPDDIKRIESETGRLRFCFRAIGMDVTKSRRRLRKLLAERGGAREDSGSKKLRRSPESREVFSHAERLASGGDGQARPLDLLLAVLQCDECQPELDQILALSNSSCEDLARVVAESSPGDVAKPATQPAARKGIVDSIGRDLSELANSGKLSPVHGRREEMLAIARILLQQRKNNVILCGEAGVGKTVIVEGLACRIAAKDLPPEFHNFRIVEISLASLVAGTVYRGQFEARLEALVKEAESDPNLVLFIDEIHLLMGAGKGGGEMDAANILKPALARGNVRVIGATTTAEFRRSIEKDPAIERRFQVLRIEEPSRDETVAILRSLQKGMEAHHHVALADEAVTAAVDLTIKHQPERRLPDKAIDLLDQACSEARLQTLSGDLHANFRQGLSIGRDAVASCLARRLGVPADQIATEEMELLRDAERLLEQRIVGQSQAVSSVCGALRTARTGLRAPNKPMAVFLFAGASGSGKTELAKAVADVIFRGPSCLVRFDMSEYMEEHSVSKLIGSPPGYRDHEQGGQLTERIRSTPHSVVLLDEIEKAHPRILDLFLQVFDEGHLTDARGRKCSFKDCVIIMTSNLGAVPKAAMGFGAALAEEAGRSYDFQQSVLQSVSKRFRPELLNRVTKVIPFVPLTTLDARAIIDKLMNELNTRLAERGVTVALTEAACEHLLSEGYSREFGARSLGRTLESLVVAPLARTLIEDDQAIPCAYLVDVAARDKTILFSKKP